MNAPEKILQIGEGNFLRAFLEPLVEAANRQGTFHGSVVIVPPRKWDNCEKLTAQDCRYSVYTRGKRDGVVVDECLPITCVSRCVDARADAEVLLALMRSPDLELIVSNTTEAGIFYYKGSCLSTAMNDGYAALLTRLLWERCLAGLQGLWILPCELIEYNADMLLSCVKQYASDYGLPERFFAWLSSCRFCNTLVDRIVSGHPAGDTDDMSVACEPYFFWAVSCENRYKSTFPLCAEGFDVCLCDDVSPYRLRKVRLLNGMHTAASAAAFLSGISVVRDMVNDALFRRFLRRYADAVIAVTPMDKAALERFRDAVFERFENPFIDHKLQGICMNSVSKFNARCKAIMLYNEPQLVKMLSFTLASILRYLDGERHAVEDSSDVLGFAKTAFRSDAERVCAFMRFFEGAEPFSAEVLRLYRTICQIGVYDTLQTEVQTWK